jgi:glycosyltransferase involved in cell wall biosynthesis
MALAAGRPVVATRVGGLPEQLADEPLATLCAPDAASLAEALTSVSPVPVEHMAPGTQPSEAWRLFAVRVLEGFERFQAGRK